MQLTTGIDIDCGVLLSGAGLMCCSHWQTCRHCQDTRKVTAAYGFCTAIQKILLSKA
ncbi:hypothetical protein R8510_04691 [Ralstonia chuxiongensis]|nr:hypothetical protein R8510_04691 [Ralstonia chuxiongensis]